MADPAGRAALGLPVQGPTRVNMTRGEAGGMVKSVEPNSGSHLTDITQRTAHIRLCLSRPSGSHLPSLADRGGREPPAVWRFAREILAESPNRSSEGMACTSYDGLTGPICQIVREFSGDSPIGLSNMTVYPSSPQEGSSVKANATSDSIVFIANRGSWAQEGRLRLTRRYR